jgi:hypothetical protein
VCHFFCEKDGRVITYKEYFEKIRLLLKCIDSLARKAQMGKVPIWAYYCMNSCAGDENEYSQK